MIFSPSIVFSSIIHTKFQAVYTEIFNNWFLKTIIINNTNVVLPLLSVVRSTLTLWLEHWRCRSTSDFLKWLSTTLQVEQNNKFCLCETFHVGTDGLFRLLLYWQEDGDRFLFLTLELEFSSKTSQFPNPAGWAKEELHQIFQWHCHFKQ